MDFSNKDIFILVYWVFGSLYSYTWVRGAPEHLSGLQRVLIIANSFLGWPFLFTAEFILNGAYKAEVHAKVMEVKDAIQEDAFYQGFDAGVHSAMTAEDDENASPVIMIPPDKQDEFMKLVEGLTGEKIEIPKKKSLTTPDEDVK